MTSGFSFPPVRDPHREREAMPYEFLLSLWRTFYKARIQHYNQHIYFGPNTGFTQMSMNFQDPCLDFRKGKGEVTGGWEMEEVLRTHRQIKHLFTLDEGLSAGRPGSYPDTYQHALYTQRQELARSHGGGHTRL